MNWPLVALIPVAFFLGAIPFALLLGKSRGIDIRTVGSKNTGATNLGRALGVKWFFAAFLLDMLKSLLPMLAAWTIIRLGGIEQTAAIYALWVAVGFAAVLGHSFSPFIGFKGGKGVSTGLGFILGMPLFILPAIIALSVFVVVFVIWRWISLSSLTTSIVFPGSYILLAVLRGADLTGHELPLLLTATALGVLILLKHRGNIRRLLDGTEPKFGRKPA